MNAPDVHLHFREMLGPSISATKQGSVIPFSNIPVAACIINRNAEFGMCRL